LFGGNGGLLGFTISNPKYLEGPSGLDPFPLVSDGYLAKISSTFLGIFMCTFTRFVPFGIYGVDFILAIISPILL